ncbi:MAG: N-acetylmuramoyl-L-alanine amidase [Roseburia sp.]|nr:N-acetylmuramoyl-L-alanine amidase [Roseburia sp.]
MEEKLIKYTAMVLVGITVVFSVLYIKLPNVKAWTMARQPIEEQTNMDVPVVGDIEIREEEYDMHLRLLIPEGSNGEQIQIRNDYVARTVYIEIPHTDESYFENAPIMGSSDHIEGLRYVQGKEVDTISVTTDEVYEFLTAYDEEYFYLDLVKPKELYEYVVVVDAGHGGKDGGAEQAGILEKDIDLAIVLALKELLDTSEDDIKVYYTRTDDSNPSYESRVGLANEAEADLFISVHNNSYRSSSEIKGTEVMYSESFVGRFSSQRLAEICMEELTNVLGSNDRGILKGDSIYIIKNSEVPVALIEVGFMTNREELKLLNSETYQKKTAEAIYNAIFQALEEVSAIEE